MNKYIVASSKDWFKIHTKSKEYKALNIIEISKKDELNVKKINEINPKFIFFPHWNWKVPTQIHKKYDCIVFHTAPLPRGRGGSPIQNLILQGHKESPVCALKMTDVLDGGPVYDFINVSLSGNIDEIFSRIAFCVEKLILKICQSEINPTEQKGDVSIFKRLSENDNELSTNCSLEELYDRIRMVDGQNYPKAFIKFGNKKIEFSNAFFDGKNLKAQVIFKLKK